MAPPERPETDWSREALIYDAPHARLELFARLISRLPPGRLLDVGCGTGRLGALLGERWTYFGCDLTEHAREVLEEGRFLQIDLDRAADLTFFGGRGIEVVSVSGVLEYLDRPLDLLRSVHALLRPRAHLFVSIINFDGRRFRDPCHHHAGWIYKPKLEDLQHALERTGFAPCVVHPVMRERGALGRLAGWLARQRGADHPYTKARAAQFILHARRRSDASSSAHALL